MPAIWVSLFADADLQPGGYRKGCKSNGQRGQAGQPEQVSDRRQALQRRLQRTTAKDQYRDVERQDQQRQQQTAALEPNRKRRTDRTERAERAYLQDGMIVIDVQ